MRNQTHSHFAVFLLLVLLVSSLGCGGTYSSDLTINGTRTVTRKSNDTARTLKTPFKVAFINGQIASFDPGAIIEIKEVDKGKTIKGEFRESDGEMKLFVEHDGKMVAATAEEEKWGVRFLSLMAIDDRDDDVVAIEQIKEKMETSSLSSALDDVLDDLSFGDSQEKTLIEVIETFALTTKDQKTIVDAAMEHLSFSSNQAAVLQELIQLKNLDAATAKHIRNSIDDLSKSKQKDIEDALVERGF